MTNLEHICGSAAWGHELWVISPVPLREMAQFARESLGRIQEDPGASCCNQSSARHLPASRRTSLRVATAERLVHTHEWRWL